MNPARRHCLLVLAGFAAISVLFCLPILADFGNWGIQDWDWFLLVDGVARDSVLKYGQFPLWNPFFKGGMPLFAHPESNILSPAFVVLLLCGEIAAAKINIIVHLFIGLTGTWYLAKYYKLNTPAAFLAAVLFMLNSSYSLALSVGMEWAYGIAFMPWTFLFFLKSREDFRFTIATALLLAVTWLSGGVYPFTISLLFMGTYFLAAASVREWDFKKGVTGLTVITLLAVLLAAIKFFPAVEFTQQYTRHSDLYAGYSLESFFYGLLGTNQTLGAFDGKSLARGFLHGFSQGMDETGMYVGIVPSLLFLAGLGLTLKKNRALIVCLLIFIWLSFGVRSEPLSLWELVQKIPPYSLMRSVERFHLVYLLILGLLAGAGLQFMSRYLAKKTGKENLATAAAWLVLLLVIIDLFRVNVPVLQDAFQIPPIAIPPRSETFVQIGGFPEYDKNGPLYEGGHDLYTSYGAAYPAFLANAGSVYGYISMPVPDKAVPTASADYRGEIFLVGTSGQAGYSYWSFNRLVGEARADGAGMLVFNQNYYPGWKAADGRKVEPVNGLLGVRVGAGQNRVELYYRPTSFLVGAAVSLLTIIGLVGWFLINRRRAGDVTR